MIDLIKKYKVFIRLVSLVLVCFLAIDTVGLASDTLAPRSRLTLEEFKQQYRAGFTLLAHEAINKYIEEQISVHGGIENLKQRFEYVGRPDGGHQMLLIVAIPGLLKKTGQPAHLGLGRWNGVPTIYIDKRYYYSEEMLKNKKKLIARGKRLRHAEDALKHEMGEAVIWESLYRKLKTHFGGEFTYEEMRRLIEEYPGIFKDAAEVFHGECHSLASAYREEYGSLLDTDSIYGLYRKYGLDSDSVDVNIAAGTGQLKNGQGNGKVSGNGNGHRGDFKVGDTVALREGQGRDFGVIDKIDDDTLSIRIDDGKTVQLQSNSPDFLKVEFTKEFDPTTYSAAAMFNEMLKRWRVTDEDAFWGFVKMKGEEYKDIGRWRRPRDYRLYVHLDRPTRTIKILRCCPKTKTILGSERMTERILNELKTLSASQDELLTDSDGIKKVWAKLIEPDESNCLSMLMDIAKTGGGDIDDRGSWINRLKREVVDPVRTARTLEEAADTIRRIDGSSGNPLHIANTIANIRWKANGTGKVTRTTIGQMLIAHLTRDARSQTDGPEELAKIAQMIDETSNSDYEKRLAVSFMRNWDKSWGELRLHISGLVESTYREARPPVGAIAYIYQRFNDLGDSVITAAIESCFLRRAAVAYPLIELSAYSSYLESCFGSENAGEVMDEITREFLDSDGIQEKDIAEILSEHGMDNGRAETGSRAILGLLRDEDGYFAPAKQMVDIFAVDDVDKAVESVGLWIGARWVMADMLSLDERSDQIERDIKCIEDVESGRLLLMPDIELSIPDQVFMDYFRERYGEYFVSISMVDLLDTVMFIKNSIKISQWEEDVIITMLAAKLRAKCKMDESLLIDVARDMFHVRGFIKEIGLWYAILEDQLNLGMAISEKEEIINNELANNEEFRERYVDIRGRWERHLLSLQGSPTPLINFKDRADEGAFELASYYAEVTVRHLIDAYDRSELIRPFKSQRVEILKSIDRLGEQEGQKALRREIESLMTMHRITEEEIGEKSLGKSLKTADVNDLILILNAIFYIVQSKAMATVKNDEQFSYSKLAVLSRYRLAAAGVELDRGKQKLEELDQAKKRLCAAIDNAGKMGITAEEMAEASGKFEADEILEIGTGTRAIDITQIDRLIKDININSLMERRRAAEGKVAGLRPRFEAIVNAGNGEAVARAANIVINGRRIGEQTITEMLNGKGRMQLDDVKKLKKAIIWVEKRLERNNPAGGLSTDTVSNGPEGHVGHSVDGARGSPAKLLNTIHRSTELLNMALSEGISASMLGFEEETEAEEGLKLLRGLGILQLVSSPGEPLRWRFSPMMVSPDGNKDYTRTMINAVSDIRYMGEEIMRRGDLGAMSDDQLAAIRELVKMTVIHEIDKMQEPKLPEGAILCHILERNLLSVNQEVILQNVNKSAEESKGKERFYVTEKGESIAGAIGRITNKVKGDHPDMELVFDIALSSEGHIKDVPEKVMMLVFEPPIYGVGDFSQLEGIAAALRALHIKNRTDAILSLRRIYVALVGQPCSYNVSERIFNNPARLARSFVFNLPKIEIGDYDSIRRFNERLRELLTAA